MEAIYIFVILSQSWFQCFFYLFHVGVMKINHKIDQLELFP